MEFIRITNTTNSTATLTGIVGVQGNASAYVSMTEATVQTNPAGQIYRIGSANGTNSSSVAVPAGLIIEVGILAKGGYFQPYLSSQ